MAFFRMSSRADSARKSFGAGIGKQVAAGQLPPAFFLVARFGFGDVRLKCGAAFAVVRIGEFIEYLAVSVTHAAVLAWLPIQTSRTSRRIRWPQRLFFGGVR